jgi:hypothetical protein
MKTPRYLIVPLFVLIFFVPRTARAQRSRPSLLESLLDCARNEEGGPWVQRNVYRDGLLRFNYIHEPPKGNDPQDPRDLDNVYMVFWNQDKTEGEFLNFALDRLDSRRMVTVSNDGQIHFTKGRMRFDFFSGGEWTRVFYMTRIRKLYRAPVQTKPVRDIKRTATLCDSFVNPHLEWYKKPSR